MLHSIFYKPFLALIAISLVFAQCASKAENKKQQSSPETVEAEQENAKPDIPLKFYTIDLSKEIPKKSFMLEIEETNYISLETTDKILLDWDARIIYYSEKYCIINNRGRGNIFIFNHEGKCVSHFNHKGQGPEEYPNISDIIADEKNEEIFVLTIHGGNSILVYSFEGQFKRKLNKPFPTWTEKIYNFNDTTLLTSTEISPDIAKTDPPPMQYLLLSKKTGQIVSPLNINLTQRASFDKPTGYFSSSSGVPTILKSGEDFYISDLASDTIYHVKQGGEVKPLIARTPAVFDTNPQIFFQAWYRRDCYLLLTKTINECITDRQGGIQFKKDEYALNLKTGEFGNAIKYHSNNENDDRIGIGIELSVDAPSNISIGFVSATELIEGLENGEVKSEALKKIASSLKEDDNPVIVVTKIKSE